MSALTVWLLIAGMLAYAVLGLYICTVVESRRPAEVDVPAVAEPVIPGD